MTIRTVGNGHNADLIFFIVKKKRAAIPSLHACEQFGFINRISEVATCSNVRDAVLAEFPEVSRGLG